MASQIHCDVTLCNAQVTFRTRTQLSTPSGGALEITSRRIRFSFLPTQTSCEMAPSIRRQAGLQVRWAVAESAPNLQSRLFFFFFFFLCCSQLTSAIPAGRTAGEFFIGPRPQPRRDLQRRHGSICGAVPLFGFRVISRKTKMEGDKKQTSIFQRKLEDTSRLFLQARIHTFTSEPK